MTPRSPFGSHSWEPRFVIEHYWEGALSAAIELWSMTEFGYPPPLVFATRRPDHMIIARDRYKARDDEPEPLAISDIPRAIRTWLQTATYPEQPNFDGDEARGFTVFGAHWQCEESDAYGSLVVLPKWLEIHK